MPHSTALLLIDVINDCRFEGGEDLVRNAKPTIGPIGDLTARARAADVPVIYVNDNFGRWNDTFADVVERCTSDDSRGCEIATALSPGDADHFILKPKHSAFYLTSLDALLNKLGTERLIICGYAGDICVLFTANDAYMREYEVVVPRDCIASESVESNDCVIELMERTLGVDTRPGAEVQLVGSQTAVALT